MANGTAVFRADRKRFWFIQFRAADMPMDLRSIKFKIQILWNGYRALIRVVFYHCLIPLCCLTALNSFNFKKHEKLDKNNFGSRDARARSVFGYFQPFLILRLMRKLHVSEKTNGHQIQCKKKKLCQYVTCWGKPRLIDQSDAFRAMNDRERKM